MWTLLGLGEPFEPNSWIWFTSRIHFTNNSLCATAATRLLTLSTCQARVTVIVCVCVCFHADCYIHRFFRRNSSVIRLSVLFSTYALCGFRWKCCSKVLATFADYLCLPRFLTRSQWTKETAMASFQVDWCVGLVIVFISQLTQYRLQSSISKAS